MKGANIKFIAPSAIREPSLKFKKSYFEFYKKIKSSAFDDFKKKPNHDPCSRSREMVISSYRCFCVSVE
jgi:hypothetical protein